MIDERMLRGDRVLVWAEVFQTIGDEIFQPRERIRTCDRIPERLRATRVVRKMFFNIRDGLFDIGVVSRLGRKRRDVVFREFFAIVLIKRPLTTGRVPIGIDHDIHALPLRLIEGGHERFFAACNMFDQELRRREKRRCRVKVKPDTGFFRIPTQAFFENEIVRFGEMDIAQLFLELVLK